MSTQGTVVNAYGADGNAINTINNGIQAGTLYNPGTGLFEVQRTPTLFIDLTNVNVAVGTNNVNLYNPPAGKRFRFLAAQLFAGNGTNSLLAFHTASSGIFFHTWVSNGLTAYMPLPFNGFLAA